MRTRIRIPRTQVKPNSVECISKSVFLQRGRAGRVEPVVRNWDGGSGACWVLEK